GEERGATVRRSEEELDACPLELEDERVRADRTRGPHPLLHEGERGMQADHDDRPPRPARRTSAQARSSRSCRSTIAPQSRPGRYGTAPSALSGSTARARASRTMSSVASPPDSITCTPTETACGPG